MTLTNASQFNINVTFFVFLLMLLTFQLSNQLGRVAEVYMEIYEDFSQNDTKSYIGLRDFYCLVGEISPSHFIFLADLLYLIPIYQMPYACSCPNKAIMAPPCFVLLLQFKISFRHLFANFYIHKCLSV